MLSKRLIILFLPVFIFLASCAPEHSKVVVAEFGNQKILMDEFEKAYTKSSGNSETTKNESQENLQKFLDLYVNYKMKLRDAEVRGYTNDQEMQKEYIDYKINVGSTLFMEKNFYEPQLKEFYEKRKNEYKVAHIFRIPDSTMSKEETLSLMKNIIDSVNNGADWDKLAMKYNQDVYTQDRAGFVGYVTAGQIFSPEIENVIYKTVVGTAYPEVIQSRYGYHIIKVFEKQPRKYTIRASHILASFKDSLSAPLDSAKAYKKILEIQKKLNEGADFAEVAKKYSDDKGSSNQGGDLGIFKRGSMLPSFENAAFSLKPGEISDVFSTAFGYHIVKLTDVPPLPSFEESKSELRNMYQRTWQSKHFRIFIDSLKIAMNYKFNDQTFNIVETNIDSVRIGTKYWDSSVREQIGKLPIFSINNKNFPCDSVIAFAEKNKMYVDGIIDSGIFKSIVERYSDAKIISEKALIYDLVDNEFAALMEDYKNGIYLFKILEEEVWNKIEIDSSKLISLYEKDKENYKWKDRVEFKQIRVDSDSLAQLINSDIKKGIDFDSLIARYDKSRFDSNKGLSGLIEYDVSEVVSKAYSLNKIGDVSEPFLYENKWCIVKLISKEKARIKTFDEVRTELTGILQERESKRLEEEYIDNLKTIYKPKYYYNELSNAFMQ